ncbi:MAG: heme exporter protein CcmB [Bryobacteraceae bacterium]|nr:heme exporter protein CcmB [Bryobacteraceae bacterium]MDW8379719.1 heme exporter protein CcmB [Bryobacterales bacterium]
MKLLREVCVVAGKDLRSEFRTKECLNAALSFAIVILVLFSFAVDPSSEQIREMSGGLLWLAFAFAGALILNQSFARELPNDCLDALVASPVSAAALFLGKAAANWLLLMIVELVCLPVFGVLYNMSWLGQWPLLLLVFLLASWGVTVIGTMFSALTVNLRLRELMLPTLIYPMMIPALMAAMQLTTVLIATSGVPPEDWIWVRLLVGFDIIFTSLAIALAEVVLLG